MASILSKSIKSKAKSTIIIIGTIFFDAIIMIFWVSIQYGVDWGIKYFQPLEFSLLICYIFQALLAFSTLIPVVYYILSDIIKIVKKLKKLTKTKITIKELEE